MKPIKSAVTFFRKQLGFKGRTQHNGRGVYEMDIDHDQHYEMSVGEKIRACLVKWQEMGIVECVEDEESYLVITLKDSMFVRPDYLEELPDSQDIPNQSYRSLWYGKKYGEIGVIMKA